MSSALAQAKLPTALDVVEAAVRTRGIKHFGERVDVSSLLDQAKAGFEAVVMDEANRVFGQKAAILDGIIVGGGGAEMLLNGLKQRYPNAVSSDEPESPRLSWRPVSVGQAGMA